MNAVCPACGRTLEFDEKLPPSVTCPGCGADLAVEKVGYAVHLKQQKETAGGDAAALAEVRDMKDPVQKHKALLALEQAYPNSLAVQKELLMHGRLHERNPKKLDFSVIKCYVLNPYEDPEAHSAEARKSFAREIFDHPRLIRCLSLAPDREMFTEAYLKELSAEYIRLFLQGSSRYNGSFMGLFRSGKPEKALATPVARMLNNIAKDQNLTEDERAALRRAVYAAFESLYIDTTFLNQYPGVKT